MEVGILTAFQNFEGRRDDAEHFQDELRLCELAEPLGFDTLWCAEHHFANYSAMPDNAQHLAYMAAKTSRIKLGTAAFILPWNHPLRVAEKITMLDHQSQGRAVLGLGRGLARKEFHGFGVEMSETRDRFDEASRMIIDAVEKGFIEGSGPYYPQARTEIRPRPISSFRDRFYCIGMSPESADQAARLGARLAAFSQQAWEPWAEGILARYQKLYKECHAQDAPPPLTVDIMYCDASERSAELSRRFIGEYYGTVLEHYEIDKGHLGKTRGYESYAGSDVPVEPSDAQQGYLAVQAAGTPEQILASLAQRREIIGDFEFGMIAKCGSMTLADAESSVRLFAREVLPELHRW